ncbi:hypothetical protein BV20DRAFT_943271 [Pilatotrama ljubarskyi]|nr:hypothetical protein BV20DRAFT_943271 [Pilatotrama ljubarskyi]
MDDEDLEEDEEEDTLLSGFMVGGAAASKAMRNEARRRRYLRRKELLPDPREETPWQRLYASRSDRAFITTMGIDVATFHHILDGGFSSRWESQPVQRVDVQQLGVPRVLRRSLDAAGALGLVLHWLSSSMRETGLQQIFALTPATANRYLQTTIDLLHDTLLELPDAVISWPTLAEFQEYSDIISALYPLLVGAFGTVDGLKLAVQVSADEEIENATYNGWLHDHFITNILSFCPKGTLIHAILNAPGSWHDAKVARELYERLLNHTPPGYYLVADTAFPRTTPDIQQHIRAPVKSDDPLPDDPRERRSFVLMSRQLLSCRQSAEWGMREIQGSFGRLRIPLPIDKAPQRLKILTVIVRMHQVRVRRVGISEIRNVYVPIWREGDELTKLWFEWEKMLFSEIRRLDRVSKFHHVSED